MFTSLKTLKKIYLDCLNVWNSTKTNFNCLNYKKVWTSIIQRVQLLERLQYKAFDCDKAVNHCNSSSSFVIVVRVNLRWLHWGIYPSVDHLRFYMSAKFWDKTTFIHCRHLWNLCVLASKQEKSMTATHLCRNPKETHLIDVLHIQILYYFFPINIYSVWQLTKNM